MSTLIQQETKPKTSQETKQPKGLRAQSARAPKKAQDRKVRRKSTKPPSARQIEVRQKFTEMAKLKQLYVKKYGKLSKNWTPPEFGGKKMPLDAWIAYFKDKVNVEESKRRKK